MDAKDYIYDDTFWEWIEKHYGEDVDRLRFSSHGNEMLMDACLQIECRKRTARKLSKTLANKRFYFPNSLSAEQSSSDAMAEFHSTLIGRGARILDMTSGLGIDAMHLSKKAESVDACEMNGELSAALKFNCLQSGINNVRCINDDCIRYIESCLPDSYDSVFIDPARRDSSGSGIFALSQCKPDIVSALPTVFRIAPELIIKASPMIDITATIKELPGISRIIAAGNAKECKEIIAVCHRGHTAPPVISVSTEGYGCFDFTQIEEKSSECRILSSSPRGYLYEPFPAVMKAAPFNVLSKRYDIGKIAANTHLFVSPNHLEKFPGHCFLIKDVIPFDKNGIRKVKSEYDRLNITTRNFILPPDQLVKKLKIKEGGNLQLFAVTDHAKNKLMIITEPVKNN